MSRTRFRSGGGLRDGMIEFRKAYTRKYLDAYNSAMASSSSTEAYATSTDAHFPIGIDYATNQVIVEEASKLSPEEKMRLKLSMMEELNAANTCKNCGNMSHKRDERGNCPSCGGVRPEPIEWEWDDED